MYDACHMAQDTIFTCSVFVQFVWNLHNQKILERPAHWRHKIEHPSYMYMRLDLPPLQLLEHFEFPLYYKVQGDIWQQAVHWKLQI